jgi:hypothetical protein
MNIFIVDEVVGYKRLEIPVGTDVTAVFRLRHPVTGDPVDLTNMSQVTMYLEDRFSRPFCLGNVTVPAKAARIVYRDIELSAVTPGSAGNAIELVFDGVLTLAAVISAWNTANPGNQVQTTYSPTTVVPEAGTAVLEGGFDPYQQISIVGNPVLGKLQLILKVQDTLRLKIGNNQSLKLFVDFGITGPREGGDFQNLVDVTD